MPRAEETILELNLPALVKNFEYLKSHLKESTKFLAVVKAFAYGSDSVAVANYLQGLGVDYFGVAYAKEGELLRKEGIRQPILVLHPQLITFNSLIDHCLEPNLYNAKSLNAFIKEAEKKNQKDYPVHIKFNTGLNRLGFWENDVEYIYSKLSESNSVKVRSIFSHLVASEDTNETEFSEQQIKSFIKSADALSDLLGYKPMYHMLNTSGIFNYPHAQFDMVRSGIGLYGFGNSSEYDKHLMPIATLKTIISQIHMIEPGENVGYNRAYISDGYKKIAVLPIGHADGIGRQYGKGKGFVTIHGKVAKIVGNVCMDMMMVDITEIECKEGDEVIVFGQNPTASEFANTADTISYEILTAISQRVKRLIKK